MTAVTALENNILLVPHYASSSLCSPVTIVTYCTLFVDTAFMNLEARTKTADLMLYCNDP